MFFSCSVCTQTLLEWFSGYWRISRRAFIKSSGPKSSGEQRRYGSSGSRQKALLNPQKEKNLQLDKFWANEAVGRAISAASGSAWAKTLAPCSPHVKVMFALILWRSAAAYRSWLAASTVLQAGDAFYNPTGRRNSGSDHQNLSLCFWMLQRVLHQIRVF